jgi:hypothetical protein
MTSDELRALLSQRENLKLDFKREYHLSKTPPPGVNEKDWSRLTAGQRHELIKDILALTNGNFGMSDEPGYLIIGAEDDKYLQPHGTRPLFDVSHLQLTSAGLLQMVNEACYPPLPDILCERIELDGKTLIAITIPPSPHVHETIKPLMCVGGVIDSLTGQLSLSKDKPFTARTAFIRRVDGVYPASEADRRALAADKSPDTFVIEAEPLNLDEFRVPDAERERVRDTFSPPRGYNTAEEVLKRSGRLWVVGPSGLWKRHLALSLALKYQEFGEIYRVSRSVDWGQLASTGVSDSIILFPDPLGLTHYEGDKVDSEFRPWDKLCDNGNILIATSSDDVFAEAAKETRLSEFVPKDQIFFLSPDSFDYKIKEEIFKRLVNYADGRGLINESQKEWALSLVERGGRDQGAGADAVTLSKAQMHRLLGELWLPTDVERFVTDSLPEAASKEEVFDLLRRDADVEKRVHGWFCSLDDSTRCFVLTLTIFSGFSDSEIWSRHQEIVRRLRKFDPSLAAPPLGILRQRAQPYVTCNGPLEFVNPRVFQMVVKEVAKSYREYFTDEEVMELLEEWSIPDLPTTLSKEERDDLIRETEEVRNAVAKMTGEVGKFGLEDVTDLLEAWGKHRIGRIGKTVGVALKEVANDPASAHRALALLSQWSSKTSESDSHNLRWASASALGRIISLKTQFGTSEQALTILQRLAGDQSDYVVSAVPQAFRMMGSTLPIESLGAVLTRLAKRDRFTQREVARALDETSSLKAEAVGKLLDTWAATRSTGVRKTAILTLLTAHRLPRDERHPRLIKVLAAFPDLVFETLREVMEEAEDEPRRTAQTVLAGLGGYSSEAREQLVSALAGAYEKNPAVLQRVFDMLLASPNTRLRNVLYEALEKVSYFAVKTLLEEPSEQRNPILAHLIKSRSYQFEHVILEALETGTYGKIDWFLTGILATSSAGGDSDSARGFSGVDKEIQRLRARLREIETGEVDEILHKIGSARKEATKAGIKDFTELDKQLEEISHLSASDSCVDIWKAIGLAQASYAAILPNWEEHLAKHLEAKSTTLKSLKAQRTGMTLRQQVKEKTATAALGIGVASLLITSALGYILFAILIQPTRMVTFPRNVNIRGVSYPSGSQFEVVDESESEICLGIQSEKMCLDRITTLRLGHVTGTYTTKALLLTTIIILVSGSLVSRVVIHKYRDRIERGFAYGLDIKIKQAEKDIKLLIGAKSHFTSLQTRIRTEDTGHTLIQPLRPILPPLPPRPPTRNFQ